MSEEIQAVYEKLNVTHESLFVTDGGQDNAFKVLCGLKKQNPQLVVIQFQKNVGQTVAMAAWLQFTRRQRLST